MTRDPFSEAVQHAMFSGVCLFSGFLLGPWLFAIGALFAVFAASYLVIGIFRGL